MRKAKTQANKKFMGQIEIEVSKKWYNTISPEYKKYIKSSKWRKIRKSIIKRDQEKCRECNKQITEKTCHIHHLTYKNIFNEEKYLEDLITLCPECHSLIHYSKRKTTGSLYDDMTKGIPSVIG